MKWLYEYHFKNFFSIINTINKEAARLGNPAAFYSFLYSYELGLFLTKFGINIQKPRHDISQRTSPYHDEEEHRITHSLLQGSSKHARYHHRQSHEGSTQRIMGGFMVTTAIINKV